VAEGERAWTAKRAALITTGANLLMSALGVFTGMVAARLLGPKGRGELAAIQAWPTALASLALLGTSEAVPYFCARETEGRDRYLCAALLIGLSGTLTCSFLGFLAMPWLLAAQDSLVVWGARIFLLQIWLYLAIGMPSEVLRSAGRFLAWNVLRLCPVVLWAATLVVAWGAALRRAVPISTTYVILEFSILALLVPLVRSEVPRLGLPSRAQLAETLAFGLPAAGAFLPRAMNLKLDQILMAGLMPPGMLGQYVVAVAWSNAGMSLVHGLSAIVVPEVAGRVDAGQQGAALARVTRMGSLIGAISALGLLASASLGIPFFFGDRFRQAVPAAKMLALAGGAAGFNLVLSEGMRGLGKPVAVLRAELLALAITAGGLWLLLRPFGICGAALVSLAAYTCTTFWLLAEARLVTGTPMKELAIPQWSDVRSLSENFCAAASTLIRKLSMMPVGTMRSL
jgi:O-antigen/teichoic acid export membrane protein